MGEKIRVGTTEELQKSGSLTAKVGAQPICVFWCDEKAYAVDDRCPHMGFPLHRGTVEQGLLTCHWHHARFDLESGGTLDPFAGDVRTYPVEIDGSEVSIVVEPSSDQTANHVERLTEGLEQGLVLVLAKSVLSLLEDLGADEGSLVVLRTGVDFGTRYREAGWGAGLTVLTAMANVLPVLRPTDRVRALVHGLAFVSRDTLGRPPHFPLTSLGGAVPGDRLAAWYRRFVDTRNGEAAERTLATATANGSSREDLVAVLGAAATDHVFIDGGHTIDFTNKAFEVLDHLGWEHAGEVLPTLAHQSAAASRSEETGSWRHPHDLTQLLARAESELPDRIAGCTARTFGGDEEVDSLAWAILGEEPDEVIAALDSAIDKGATAEELARAVAYAAALRVTRFHTQNDHGDWDVVHHGFTSANAVHQLATRAGTTELVRGVYQGAMRVFLDRFLNVPAARLPGTRSDLIAGNEQDGTYGDLSLLQQCWDREGMVDEAGAIVYRWIRSGGDQSTADAALGSALLAEDAEFHWFQTYEAAVRQAAAWPTGSEQAALILAGTARFLAAHTPTRRELAQVVRIATRLRRGEPLYEQE